jgi:pimeloyl-ACP methyl ester carboxylesterase
MATATDPPETTANSPAVEEGSGQGHIGLIVLCSIAFGLILGMVLTLGVFGGGRENVITAAALISFALGMLMLFELARRRTDQPQPWALPPAAGLAIVGLALLILGPSGRVLGWLGWVWPLLLAALVVWSWRGAHRSLHNWSRRALLYPAFVVLGLVALGGAYETISEATTSNTPATGRTYLVAGHSLYLSCAGSGSPTVILFNGLGERTPSWAWVQRDVAAQTRVCVFDRAGQGWSGKAPGRQDAHQLSADVDGLLAAAKVPGPYVLAGHSVGGTYALAYAMDFPKDVAGVALIDSATPYQFDLPTYPRFYSMWRRVQALLPTLAWHGFQYAAAGCASPGAGIQFLAARGAGRSRRVRRATNGLSPRPGSHESRWEAALRPDGRSWPGVGMVRCPGQAGDTFEEQRSSDDAGRDARSAPRR